ncbi:hypothetical protein ABID30_002546 [Enterococcus rotai]|uniref:WxL domain-containing protein n=1 Tax=Enterococcus rotai TaxID=118060 RepID=A0A0U2LUJ7_9ENTE|nr:WxL domain-containing protein [Enterococcus rotai]ALS36325.1 hypothetical protein ATZ35_03860 [Enterococcus rotai]
MKNTHKICGAALLAVIGLGLALPGATKAAESDSFAGEGNVEFQKDTTPDTITPPDTDGPVLPYPPVNPSTADMKIVGITPLDFEKHDILTDGSSPTYEAKPFNDATFGDMENFVDFKDVRSTTDHTYKIYGKLSTQFAHANGSQLKGAFITFANTRVASNGTANAEALKPVGAVTTPVKLEPAADGLAAGENTLFLDNTDATKGFGQYKLAFGNRATSVENIRESVKLTVPGDNMLSVGKYTAEITWTISDTPL